MEKMKSFYKNKKVLVTGATGFKGAWLCAWLLKLGAKVYGTGYNPNQNKKWNNQNDDNSFKKVNPIDVIFILKDEFEGKKALDDKQYAIIKPVKVGISGENYYAVESGAQKGEVIVTGGYRVLSKELNHGDLVSTKNTDMGKAVSSKKESGKF